MRTLAREAKFADQVNHRRAEVARKRELTRASTQGDPAEAMEARVLERLNQIYWPEIFERPDGVEMLEDAASLLCEHDACKDHLDRPGGEIIVCLTRIVGLDPEASLKQGDEWMIPSEPHHFENKRDRRLRRPIHPGSLA